jgi:hypothetical protein
MVQILFSVQWRFHRKFSGEPPSRHSIRSWYKLFTERGCNCKGKSRGKRPFIEESVNTVRAACFQSPRKLAICPTIKYDTIESAQNLPTRLKFKRYHYHLLQHVTTNNKEAFYAFCCYILESLEDDKLCTAKPVLMMKPLSICPFMLTDIILEFGGARISMQ